MFWIIYNYRYYISSICIRAVRATIRFFTSVATLVFQKAVLVPKVFGTESTFKRSFCCVDKLDMGIHFHLRLEWFPALIARECSSWFLVTIANFFKINLIAVNSEIEMEGQILRMNERVLFQLNFSAVIVWAMLALEDAVLMLIPHMISEKF